MKKTLMIPLLLCGLVCQPADAAFTIMNDFFGGNNQRVFAIKGTTDGFVAARQSTAVEYLNDNGQLECHVLFKIKDRTWHSLGDIGAINNGQDCPLMSGIFPIKAVQPFGPDICVGGDFTDLGGVIGLSYFACYSETLGWYQPNGIGNGPNGPVNSLDGDGTHIYVGGSFTEVNNGDLSARNVVKTDGLFWYPLYTDAQQTSNGVSNSVQAVFSTTSFVVVQMGNSTLTWNSSVPEWLVRGTHNGSAAPHPDVVINGSTLTVSTKGASSVSGDPGGAVSDFNLGAEEWSEFGMSSGVNTHFGQLAYGLGPLYSTGDFTAFDADAKGLAWFNGITWEAAPMAPLLGDLNLIQPIDMQQGGNKFCLLTQGLPGDAQIYWNTQVCYDNNTWTGDNQAPISNVVQTLTNYQNRIIHGGDFVAAGDQLSSFVAKLSLSNRWKGISQLAWTGSGQGQVSQLQVYNGELYATGTFDQANGTPVQGIAKYDGSNWSPVVVGLNAYNSLMTVWDNKLIINGFYNNTQGPVLAWDGNAITEVGNFNQGGIFTDFAVYQGDLIAAHLASGTGRIYRYDGNGWQAFAGTITGVPLALAVDGNLLYVAGNFSGGCSGVDFVAADNIFVWDGAGCEALGAGVTNSGPIEEIRDMVIYGNGLFVTGRFNQAGGAPANSLAWWDGSNWHAFDQGLVDGVNEGQGNALLIKDDVLYVTGFFEQAGNTLSHHFAAINLDAIFSNGFD
jgi:hypothetical protein